MSEQPTIAPSREQLRGVPPQLAEAIREAVVTEDIDQLYELVNGVAEHDAEVAAFFRKLLEDYAYETLLDLFDVRGR